ncbi:hypothetical protein SAMN05421777_1048 [Fluoribacter gormanii]|uniref:Uncharacterized protein n=1 Tax=Fluoribacter gormanii TaxID=464 RepID=A0A377GJW3_9GAMM|nr:hypothetical protein SAMN05421777_1048 [Fluoribacter gormanii]STO24612.1 Uncharacterised protein [Fluoribacter gormanii]
MTSRESALKHFFSRFPENELNVTKGFCLVVKNLLSD